MCHLNIFQGELCRQLCTKLNKEFGLEKEAVLIESSCLARDGKLPQAVNLIMKRPELKLAAVHLLLSQVLIITNYGIGN